MNAKNGSTDLLWANEIEDIEDAQEDDIDTNVTADAEGDEEGEQQ
jgi:hypothetical protein